MIAIIEDKPYRLVTTNRPRTLCDGCAFQPRHGRCPAGSSRCVIDQGIVAFRIWVPAVPDEQTDDGGLLPPQGALE